MDQRPMGIIFCYSIISALHRSMDKKYAIAKTFLSDGIFLFITSKAALGSILLTVLSAPVMVARM
jgi:hypothetical protein